MLGKLARDGGGNCNVTSGGCQVGAGIQYKPLLYDLGQIKLRKETISYSIKYCFLMINFTSNSQCGFQTPNSPLRKQKC